MGLITLPTRAASPRLVLAAVSLGIFVAALDQTVVYGALATMMYDIGLPITQLDQAAWIVLGYLLGYTAAMPIIGRASDMFGHGRLYVLSLLLFIAGSAGVALSNDLTWMIAARIVQAVGGGAVVPIAMAIVADTFPTGGRAVALGIIGAAVEAGGALGPAYGGAMAAFASWRWIFWVNLPIGLFVIGLVLWLLPLGTRRPARSDYLGGVLLAAALALLSLGLAGGLTASYLVAAAVCFVAFLGWERRAADPMVDLGLFRRLTFSAATVTNLLIGGALIVAMVSIPLMSDTLLGTTPLEGGLRLLRLTITLAIGAVVGGFLCKRLGYRLPTILGLALSAVGLYLISGWDLTITDPALTIDLAVCGFGFGIVIAPISTAVIEVAKEDQCGAASSLAVMMRTVGMIIGLSALSAWGMDQFHLMASGMSLSDIMAKPETLTNAALGVFHDFYLGAVVVCLAAIVPALGLKRVIGGAHGTGDEQR